jgi:hypothetical protein
MGQGTREFTGTSGMIVFVPVYALVAKALAQTRPLQHAPGLVWRFASRALALPGLCRLCRRSVEWKNPVRERDSPAIGQAASRLKSCGDSAGRPMSKTSRAPRSINRASASNAAPPCGSP